MHSRCWSSLPVSLRSGSTTARLPCAHLGSIGLSHGLLLGKRQTRRRQPPLRLAVPPAPVTDRVASDFASVELLDYTGAPIKTYNFNNCWVRSVEINALKAGAAEQATEKFVICYDESTVS